MIGCSSQEPLFRTTQPMLPAPRQLAQREANATGPGSVTGIAFSRNHPKAPERWELPSTKLVRQLSPAWVGGVASARRLAGMCAAALSSRSRSCIRRPRPSSHSIGDDDATRNRNAFGLGFALVSDGYPVLGQGAFGRSGAAGSQAFADPRSGLAHGCNRRTRSCPAGPSTATAAHAHWLRDLWLHLGPCYPSPGALTALDH
ncbi:hypothetical protein [Amycolatopsis sp. DG1A-15b]|uniref:hypothetical protein n=1 Tax=Amycolatopsis sp. DG1A-15b TaxID=3052846 RepID=UPI00255BE4F5|nr:hypothetical protein [Amycolatopsis sp. DG1A-15b]WIX85029.1 hypothetical protein QRY02_27765 [Amycolatopsis sp. DG1A-15b]